MLTKEQKEFLLVLENNLGIVSLALQEYNIDKNTYDEWCRNIFFIEKVNEIDETSLDYVENQLLKLIGEGNISAITFYLKTKGKKRGYV